MKEKLSDYLVNSFGNVIGVDTKKITVDIEKEENLNLLKINDIVILKGRNDDEKLIGLITKVVKKYLDEEDDEMDFSSSNLAIVSLVGTFFQIFKGKNNVFKRSISSYPEINSNVFLAGNKELSIIMNSLNDSNSKNPLLIGKYASNEDVNAILNGNKFFQRHAAIVGSTGSGKSYTVANILEKITSLPHSNAIVFDLHGEYNELDYAEQIRIGSGEKDMKIPLWLFNYEEIHSLFIESSEGTSSNQRAVVTEFILREKKKYIKEKMKDIDTSIVTVDTPIPFSSNLMCEYLVSRDTEIEYGELNKTGANAGKPKEKQGQYYGKLTNLINRLQTKIDDKKYSFVFSDDNILDVGYLNAFAKKLFDNSSKRIKVIDLSEVPSDILPIIIGIVTRIINDVQFWMTPTKNKTRLPLIIVCDEAHIYMMNDTSKMKAVERKSLQIFESIAKEGRKYGIGLLIVSQRPSELNTTIVSQCNNIMSLKITNDRDKSAVANLLTDSLEGIVDTLPNLDIGECIVVGDAIMLPSKIILNEPKQAPKSATIDFWDKWEDNTGTVFEVDVAIKNLIKQQR
ncbi:ATP-binding protein [Erysipelothrix sp. HDW6B]|uniref:ATP-binding protein n=1 Tax=Erysipelothrix sp. HDW6B TaxID=2714929 RepID=UPI00140DE964|nr:ATP-binding protein [Erysipelothrix sp. HDW6B]QIK86631.1 ATP-binding protein [Erysipelothrix sp. HDW6B]